MNLWTRLLTALSAIALLVFGCLPALAHHPTGGKTPSNAFEGLLSGLAHPVIGLDHLAFVIAAGLMAVVMGKRLIIPVAFVLASLVGTGIHLLSFNLPASEFFISASVLLFGILLTLRTHPHNLVITLLAAGAGIFHGYAYGEAIIGATMTPLVSYLIGFAVIQLAIALVTYWLARKLDSQNLRSAGFTLAGVGGAFLAGVLWG